MKASQKKAIRLMLTLMLLMSCSTLILPSAWSQNTKTPGPTQGGNEPVGTNPIQHASGTVPSTTAQQNETQNQVNSNQVTADESGYNNEAPVQDAPNKPGHNSNNMPGGQTSQNHVNDSNFTNPGLVRKQYAAMHPNAAPFMPSDLVPGGQDVVQNGQSQGPGLVSHSLSGPVQKWPVEIPTASSPTASFRDQGITKHLLKTFGYPLSDTQYQMIHRYNQNIMLDQMFDPEKMMWAQNTVGQMQSQSMANSAANVERAQSASAIDYTASFLYNFTVDQSNKWNKIRDQLFIPMAILILLPGAALAQVQAIIAANSDIVQVSSPFDGIIRAIVAIFLIPATYLVVNYGIDLSNSITYTIANEYQNIFGTDMYRDALCSQVRAFPINQPNENRNAQIDAPQSRDNPSLLPHAAYENEALYNKQEDPCANKQQTQVPDEAANTLMATGRLMANGSNAALASTWNILCAFQMAYLYYLWCVGPVVAALWVWPMKQLRDALPSWVEGVLTLCFWSLFWNTVILLMACFRGVNTTGTLIESALNFLATASVQYAFDFAGLVKAAGSQAAGQAMGQSANAAQGAGSGSGASKAGAGAGAGGGGGSMRRTGSGAAHAPSGGGSAGGAGHGSSSSSAAGATTTSSAATAAPASNSGTGGLNLAGHLSSIGGSGAAAVGGGSGGGGGGVLDTSSPPPSVGDAGSGGYGVGTDGSDGTDGSGSTTFNPQGLHFNLAGGFSGPPMAGGGGVGGAGAHGNAGPGGAGHITAHHAANHFNAGDINIAGGPGGSDAGGAFGNIGGTGVPGMPGFGAADGSGGSGIFGGAPGGADSPNIDMGDTTFDIDHNFDMGGFAGVGAASAVGNQGAITPEQQTAIQAQQWNNLAQQAAAALYGQNAGSVASAVIGNGSMSDPQLKQDMQSFAKDAATHHNMALHQQQLQQWQQAIAQAQSGQAGAGGGGMYQQSASSAQVDHAQMIAAARASMPDIQNYAQQAASAAVPYTGGSGVGSSMFGSSSPVGNIAGGGDFIQQQFNQDMSNTLAGNTTMAGDLSRSLDPMQPIGSMNFARASADDPATQAALGGAAQSANAQAAAQFQSDAQGAVQAAMQQQQMQQQLYQQSSDGANQQAIPGQQGAHPGDIGNMVAQKIDSQVEMAKFKAEMQGFSGNQQYSLQGEVAQATGGQNWNAAQSSFGATINTPSVDGTTFAQQSPTVSPASSGGGTVFNDGGSVFGGGGSGNAGTGSTQFAANDGGVMQNFKQDMAGMLAGDTTTGGGTQLGGGAGSGDINISQGMMSQHMARETSSQMEAHQQHVAAAQQAAQQAAQAAAAGMQQVGGAPGYQQVAQGPDVQNAVNNAVNQNQFVNDVTGSGAGSPQQLAQGGGANSGDIGNMVAQKIDSQVEMARQKAEMQGFAGNQPYSLQNEVQTAMGGESWAAAQSSFGAAAPNVAPIDTQTLAQQAASSVNYPTGGYTSGGDAGSGTNYVQGTSAGGGSSSGDAGNIFGAGAQGAGGAQFAANDGGVMQNFKSDMANMLSGDTGSGATQLGQGTGSGDININQGMMPQHLARETMPGGEAAHGQQHAQQQHMQQHMQQQAESQQTAAQQAAAQQAAASAQQAAANAASSAQGPDVQNAVNNAINQNQFNNEVAGGQPGAAQYAQQSAGSSTSADIGAQVSSKLDAQMASFEQKMQAQGFMNNDPAANTLQYQVQQGTAGQTWAENQSAYAANQQLASIDMPGSSGAPPVGSTPDAPTMSTAGAQAPPVDSSHAVTGHPHAYDSGGHSFGHAAGGEQFAQQAPNHEVADFQNSMSNMLSGESDTVTNYLQNGPTTEAGLMPQSVANYSYESHTLHGEPTGHTVPGGQAIPGADGPASAAAVPPFVVPLAMAAASAASLGHQQPQPLPVLPEVAQQQLVKNSHMLPHRDATIPPSSLIAPLGAHVAMRGRQNAQNLEARGKSQSPGGNAGAKSDKGGSVLGRALNKGLGSTKGGKPAGLNAGKPPVPPKSKSQTDPFGEVHLASIRNKSKSRKKELEKESIVPFSDDWVM